MSQTACPRCGILNQPDPLHIEPLPSRVLELLSTNTPPQDAEVDAMRQIVVESSEHVASLQAQMDKVEELLSSLQNLHSTALNNLTKVKIVLHPIRSFPRDILTEIFLYCTPLRDDDNNDFLDYGPEFDTLCPKNHPWNLSHVCQRWREITLSTPRLWSTIYLDFERYQALSQKQCIYKGILLFARSGNLDLSMHVLSELEDIDFEDHPLTSFLETSTQRWSTLTCGLPTESIQVFSGCSFPLLRELAIGERGGYSYTAVTAFNDAPCLKTLNLYNESGAGELYEMLESLPCRQLTHMSCYDYHLELPFRSLLERSINIEQLRVYLALISLELEPGERITLPALKRIDLIERDDGCAGTVAEFLSNLRLPVICDLSLTFPSHYVCFENLDSHPNFHQITTLRIDGGMLRMPDPICDDYVQPDYIGGTETLLNFLNLMTGVEEFQLLDRKVSEQFLVGLVVDGDKEGIVRLPCLLTLDLHKCGFEDAIHARSMLTHVVYSRERLGPEGPCSALRRLVLPEKWKDLPSLRSSSVAFNSVEVLYE